MSDRTTPLAPDEMDAIRARHRKHGAVYKRKRRAIWLADRLREERLDSGNYCVACAQEWPCDARRLLAAAQPVPRDEHPAETLDVAWATSSATAGELTDEQKNRISQREIARMAAAVPSVLVHEDPEAPAWDGRRFVASRLYGAGFRLLYPPRAEASDA